MRSRDRSSTPRAPALRQWLTRSIAWAVWMGVLSSLAPPSAAFAAPVQASATTVPGLPKDGREWAALTPTQKKALAPLASQWKQLSPLSRDKWLGVADRFSGLSPEGQMRMQERMTEWARMAPNERGDARVRFQNTRELSTQDRQQRWDAYQSLSADQKEQLAQQARAKQLAARTARPQAASSAGTPDSGLSIHPVRSAGNLKANVVPDPKLSPVTPQAVAPGVVKAGPGATTTWVNQKPKPPAHQQPGMPKIAANSTYVDPVTLLPKTDRPVAPTGTSPVTNGAGVSIATPASGSTP